MVKKRKIQQKYEAESRGVFRTLFSEWIVNSLDNDYGFDFEVRLTNPLDAQTDEVSEISFYVQNKSSIRSSQDKATEDLELDDWVLFLGQRIPILIAKYDLTNKIYYWEIAQDYLWDVIEKEDPNWRSQKTKRIVLTKKIGDLNEIKTAIINSQKRITRHHSLNLGIGEGIKIDKENLSLLASITSKLLDEYKALTLLESYIAKKNGELDKAWELLINVYKSPENDENKIRAIIGIIYELNIADSEQNNQVVALANEAIQLAESLKIGYLNDFVIILRNQALLFTIIKQMSEIQMKLKIQKNQGEQLFSFFYSQELIKLNEFHLSVIQEINDSLGNFLKRKEIYYYIASLPILIDIATLQITLFAAFDRKIIEEEKVGRKKFIEQCEFVLENLSEIDLKKMLLESLANYFYLTLDQKKAVDYMSKAVKLGKEDYDEYFVEGTSKKLEQMKNNPDPYASPEKAIKELTAKLTAKELQDMTEKSLKAQGINFENDDKLTSIIKMALSDINPEEKFRHCENIHIAYLNTSPVGLILELPSMGSKMVWCKHCKSSSAGFNLDLIFSSFVEENCKDCEHHSPRQDDWTCNVKFVMDQETDPEFKKVIENFRKNL